MQRIQLDVGADGRGEARAGLGGFDVGAGKGKSLKATLTGGVVGIILDCRGRQPFAPAEGAAGADQASSSSGARPSTSTRRDSTDAAASARCDREGERQWRMPIHPVSGSPNGCGFSKSAACPLKGKVVVKQGETVTAETVVARTELPGNVQPVKAASILGVHQQDLREFMLKKEGDKVAKDEVIATNKSFFGMFKSHCKSPVDGTIE